MIIPVVRRVLEKNDAAAAEIRALFDERGIFCVNILGGAGSGKTTLLEAALPNLRDLRVAVLEGDLATTRDAERIAALGVPAVQLLTEGGCHLRAEHVRRALDELALEPLDLLVIENVGNPICPANFDLGEHARVALLSVAEGDDKPLKYPLLFRRADLVVLSKCDLQPHVRFDRSRAIQDIHAVNPSVPVLPVDARGGEGVCALVDWLRSETIKRRRCRAALAVEST